MIPVCYWSPDYIPPEPICHVHKMTDQENFIFDEFQQLLASERRELRKVGSEGAASRSQSVEGDKLTILTIDGQTLRPSVAKSERNKSFFGFYFDFKKAPGGVGLCNTQTIAGAPAKMTINRREYLAR